jgi:digalactosyldiacylglycerol synthase
MGDVCGAIPDHLADICILEEPEHLNWFKAPFTAKAWMEKFQHVIGIVHTNYMAYVKADIMGHVASPLICMINKGGVLMSAA